MNGGRQSLPVTQNHNDLTITARSMDCKNSWTLRYCIGEEEVIDALILIFNFNTQLPLSNLTGLYVCSIFNKEGLTQSYLYSKGGNDEVVISDVLQGRREKIDICCKSCGRKQRQR